MEAGSYLVARCIRMHIEVWDRSSLTDQEQTFGRTKDEGAPLGAAVERDPMDFDATGDDGAPLVPMGAHVRLASQTLHDHRILRRGYSFTDGVVPGTTQLDAGLFFLAYQRDPGNAFIPIQQRLAADDALNEYIQHVGSAIFAIPPGVPGAGRYIGDTLLGA
jgi:deferrochelatase/peroxidase EfeB